MSRRRNTSRASRQSSRNQGLAQLPFAALKNPYAPMEIISADQVETIHQTSLKILRDIGLRVDNPAALKLLSDLKADVDYDNNRVRLAPELVEELLRDIPSEFTIHARNPEKTLRVGGNSIRRMRLFSERSAKCLYSTICSQARRNSRPDSISRQISAATMARNLNRLA